MKTEYAVSEELVDRDNCIDADTAYDLYWNEKVITNPRAFKCPAGNCFAQATCVNLEKDREDMKVDPHFRFPNGGHSDDCDFIADMEQKNSLKIKIKTKAKRSYVMAEDCHKLEIIRPKSHKETDKESREKTQLKSSSGRAPSSKSTSLPDSYYKRRNIYYYLLPFVTRFEKFYKNRTLNEEFIDVHGYPVSYKDMFVDINEQDLDSLSKYRRIYYGRATVVYLASRESFLVKFDEKFYAGIDENGDPVYIQPSTFINKSQISGNLSGLAKRVLSSVEKNQPTEIWFFVYGTPKLNGEYINIRPDSLDFIAIRKSFNS